MGSPLDDISRAARETRPAPAHVTLIAYRFLRALSNADHAKVRVLADFYGRTLRGADRYYLALSHLLTGQCELGLQLLEGAPIPAIDPADSAFLRAQILSQLDRRNDARRTLEHATTISRRLKPFAALADLVDNRRDFLRFETVLRASIERGRVSASNFALAEYRIKAALRAREYDFALSLASGEYQRLAEAQRFEQRTLSPRAGETALRDLSNALRKTTATFFLVSGTLLGAIREGRLLPHDNDIDVGIWAEDDMTSVREAVSTSGCFLALPQRSPWTLRIRHVNGIAIDIFRHFRDELSYWHGGVKAKWHNTPFQLVRRDLLGGHYFIPSSPERYLEENYGDWRQVATQFDSILDTPNVEMVNRHECLVHYYRKLATSRTRRNLTGVRVYSERILQLSQA